MAGTISRAQNQRREERRVTNMSISYIRVGKPLLSLKTAGSMDVERAAKHLKTGILTKERNSLSDEKAVVLFRAALNLKQLMLARQTLKNKVVDAKRPPPLAMANILVDLMKTD